MGRLMNYLAIALLCFLLVLIRFFEESLFYDPYLTFFKNDYLYVDSPRREVAKLVAFTTLRYGLNTLISLGIIFLFFKDRGMLKFSAVIYALAFVVLIFVYLYFVVNPRQEDYYMFFNVRRFLIQPVILILLLPAFYYYRLKN